MPPSPPDSATRAAAPAPERLAFERLLADLSARFVNLPPPRVDGAIVDALREIVLLLDADRCQLIRFAEGSDEVYVTHSWAVDGVPAVTPKEIGAAFPWVFRRLRDGLPVVTPRVADLPREAAVDKASFHRIGTRSNLSMPLKVAGDVVGLLAVGCLRRERDWPGELVARLGTFADVFANALAHKRAQESLDAAITFERTISAVLAALLTAPRSEQDRVVEDGLRAMARTFGVERATLWERIGDAGFRKTHRWLAEGVPVPPDSPGPAAMPWISAHLAGGTLVRFARHADLPPEAAADVAMLRQFSIGAAVIVPLAGDGAVVGALSFATEREGFEWPDALLPRVQLFGEVLAAALARQTAERREREAQAQAAHASRVGTMGVLAASLVHELTQPLAASLANAETAAGLLAAPAPDLDELRATVADIVADDRRVGDLIQQLRRFLRRGEVERAELDLRRLIDEALRFVGGEAAGKGVEIALDCAEPLPKLVGDRVQLQQVLLNLLSNAIDAVAANAPGTRRVAVLARRTASGAAVEVTDAGHGLDDATLARIFQPFFTTKPGGMGLGLSISQTIVAAHGGMLSVRSAPGRGTTFRAELPSAPPEVGAARAARDRRRRWQRLRHRRRPVDAPGGRPPAAARRLPGRDVRFWAGLPRPGAGARHRLHRQRRPVARPEWARPAGVARAGGARAADRVRERSRGHPDHRARDARRRGQLPRETVHPGRAACGGCRRACAEPRDRRRAGGERRARERYESLTPREREVFALVAAGLLNKVIADRLGAAEATVKIHRGRVMEKLGADSVADLVRMAERLGLPSSAAIPG